MLVQKEDDENNLLIKARCNCLPISYISFKGSIPRRYNAFLNVL